MPYTQPVIDPTAYVGALCTIDGGMPYTHYGEEQLSLPPTTIGARSFLMKRTHVGHNARIGEDCEFGAGVVVCGLVRIGDRVRIGGNAWIRPFVQIGDDARIGGGSVVVKDVPRGEVWAGNPAKPLRTGREAKERGQAVHYTRVVKNMTLDGCFRADCSCGWKADRVWVEDLAAVADARGHAPSEPVFVREDQRGVADHDPHFHMPVTA